LILQTGSFWNPGRDSFRTFLKKFTRDSIELDQACFEVQHNRKGDPCAFYALDGATMRLADANPVVGATANPEQVRYVQVYDEVIIGEFSARDLCFGVRNPRSTLGANGYGYSELEMIINVVTASLWSFEYNQRQFSNGSMVNGVLNFAGNVSDKQVDAFKRQWKMMIAGVSNAHRVPMVNVDELQWVDFGKSNRDMEFGAWMDWLIKIVCAVMLFDPAEINFNYGNTGQTSQMFATPVDSKLKASKDRGLRPLLTDISDWLNQYIVFPLDPYFRFEFLGLDAKGSDQAIDQGKKRSEYIMTVDELRAEEDLEPLPDGKGEVILSPAWIQFASGQGGGGGEFDEGAPDEGAPEAGDVTDIAQTGGDDESPDADDYDFDSLFPEKSVRADSTLKKSARKAKVRVYEIDL